MSVYYNENDPFAAAWLQELIKANVIAQGDVDDRSIKEVKADDLKKYTQCHFFAGIGVWAYALDRAGWGDRQVWTGSCPCQPFSAAGKKGGFDDSRHLWPDWFRLIEECKPDTVFGEQIAAKDGLMWFDLVSTDLEGEGYAVGAADLCAAGLGAPHIRQRLYFVAHHAADGRGKERTNSRGIASGNRTERQSTGFESSSRISNLADAECEQLRASGSRSVEQTTRRVQEEDGQRKRLRNDIGKCGSNGGVGNTDTAGSQGRRVGRNGPDQRVVGPHGVASKLAESDGWHAGAEGLQRSGQYGQQSEDGGIVRGATSGFWREADWIPCIDGKARPVEPGTFPLATGIANRVGLLRGYGNSLTAPVAQAFIEAYLEVEKDNQ